MEVTYIHVGTEASIQTTELVWFKCFLSNLGKSCQAEEITLHVASDSNVVDWTRWEAVDCILAGVDFRSLRKVFIELYYSQRGSFSSSSLHEGLIGSLPLLCARDILRIRAPIDPNGTLEGKLWCNEDRQAAWYIEDYGQVCN